MTLDLTRVKRNLEILWICECGINITQLISFSLTYCVSLPNASRIVLWGCGVVATDHRRVVAPWVLAAAAAAGTVA